MKGLARSLTVLVLVGSSKPAAPAQGGYRTELLAEVGLEYQVPRSFDAIPTEPTEEWVLAQWAEKVPTDPKKRRDLRPEIRIVWIDRTPLAQPVTRGPDDAPPPPPGEDEEGGGQGSTPVATAPAPVRIDSTQRYFERYLAGWTPATPEPEKERDGMRADHFALQGKNKGKTVGWLWEFSDEKRICLFLAFCHEDDAKEQLKVFRTVARSARFGEPQAIDLSRWERHYERNPQFIDPEYRLKARARLVRGWEADDTENYIFVYSTKDQKLLGILKRELEAIREEYARLFPPAHPVTAVSTVRVCKSLDEYHQYGGPKGSGGYWNSREQELVFFDYDSMDEAGKKKAGRANSRIVLYHEAFHQYIHYSTGELPPHSWFNEGTGDYFSGANIGGGKVKGIGVNPWRIATIQRGIAENKTIPWSDILRFEQPQFYERSIVGMCYAQAWSLIYFLRESKVAQKHPVWSRINQTYFESLKASYAAELSTVADGDQAARSAAGKRARERALDEALRGLDYAELDRAWRAFVMDLKVPR